MSKECSFKTCKRESRVICQCCNQYFCRDHFNEHDDLIHLKLHPLADQINKLADQLTSVSIEHLISNSRQKLDEWRVDSHKVIDYYYEKKLEELNRYVKEILEEQRIRTNDTRSKITKLIDNQKTTSDDIRSLTLSIDILKENMDEIIQKSVQLDIRSLIIDDNLIHIEKLKKPELDLLNFPPLYKTVQSVKGSGYSNLLASNDQFLLILDHENLYLFDEALSITKTIVLKYFWARPPEINDVCWSAVLDRFLLMTNDGIFLFNENKMSVECVETIQDDKWYKGACTDRFLYLLNEPKESHIYQFNLMPSIQFNKYLKISDKSNENEYISSIASNKETLTLSINSHSRQDYRDRIELRSSMTFQRLWVFQLNRRYNSLRCSLMNNNEWLLVVGQSRFYHITEDGKLKGKYTYCAQKAKFKENYDTRIGYVVNTHLFRSNILAVNTTHECNFYKL